MSKLKLTRPKQLVSEKVHRNQPCPCNSGKKFKHCHLNQAKGVMSNG